MFAALLLAQTVGLSSYEAMRWRYIGPMRGGRTAAVAGVAGDPFQYYIGVVNGGVWKTVDAGRTWEPIFEASIAKAKGVATRVPQPAAWIFAGWGAAGLVLGWLASALVFGRKRDEEAPSSRRDPPASKKERA